ncbi:hypothetical protein CEUSTIGMA_g109.t1 [Chlamydomonas eustigma]|uniref:RRM domain-containing protein n=1 Tax=Chlamydomonas eustigma TaxID=1157962 RepID=A0A250WPA1_9CHLO|nr:hypothetical protein CEUSTIGMA_g109.t1 [Chlamydomonas eustigma]|eukprot:GAX72653.1 hypothetical protein CEUSTIGMA_g109.t1 [Chlamydomonas eustigma]
MGSVEGSSSSSNEVQQDVAATLYFGNLHPFVQQGSLEDLCAYFGAVEVVKVIKDKGTGSSAGYGFVKFSERAFAEAALKALNGRSYLGQDLRVNWALPNNHKEDTSHHFHIFVGDLSCDVTDAILFHTFSGVGQCSDARVMWDNSTGRSKGYGFVSFRTKEDAELAIGQMQGKQVGSRKIRVGWAQHKQEEGGPQDEMTIDRSDPSNTNVYLGNISPETSEQDLTAHFSVYGPISEIKLHKKGGYGFVKYERHVAAVKAIVASHGRELHGRVLKCAWGKNTATNNKSGSINPINNMPAMTPHVVNPGMNCVPPGGVLHELALAGPAASATTLLSLASLALSQQPRAPLCNPQVSNHQPSHHGLADILHAAANVSSSPVLPVTNQNAYMGLGVDHSLLYNQGNMFQVLPIAFATQLMMRGLQSQQYALDLQALAAYRNPAISAGGMHSLDGLHTSSGLYSSMGSPMLHFH